jgi:hypothetical protein
MIPSSLFKPARVVLLAVILSLLVLAATAQKGYNPCEANFIPVAVTSFGINGNGTMGATVEIGMWGRKTPLSFYAGYSFYESIEHKVAVAAKTQKAYDLPSMQTIFYVRVGAVVVRNEDRNFFNEATVAISKYPEMSYRIYKRYGEKFMLGLEPRVSLQKTIMPGANINFTCTF